MNVKELAEALDLKVLAGEKGLSNAVTNGYVGDLLSWVMSRATEGDAWVTVQNNVNVVAVAVLTECACIILPDDITPDEACKQKADEEGVPILGTHLSAFEIVLKIKPLL